MFGWHDVAGTAGAAIIVATYYLLQSRKISSRAPSYSILNGVGALLILVSLSIEFNLSAFVVELFWFLISCIGVLRGVQECRGSRESSR